MSYIAKRTDGEAGGTLAFTFHGTGGTEDQFHGLMEQILPGAHVVSPRGDVSEHGANRYFRRTGEGVYDMPDLAGRTEAMAAFMQAEIARVQPAQVVALGYSNGANILLSVALKHPELMDAMVAMHPLIPWDPDAQPGLKGRRILVTLGERDPICPMPLNSRLLGYLTGQGAEVSTVVHGGGHEIRDEEIAGAAAFLRGG